MQYLAYFADIIIFYQGDIMKKIKKYKLPYWDIVRSVSDIYIVANLFK